MNLVYIAIDTLRADRLGCYGYGKPTSPEIDKLAAQGVRFANCFSASNCTHPGYTTMLSGLTPLSHGVVAHTGDPDFPEKFPWLPEILKENGYTTISVSSLASMKEWFQRGYDDWDVSAVDERHPQFQGGRVTKSERILAHACDMLEEHQGEKFFLFFHIWDPHTPYQPPDEFNTFYSGQDPGDPDNHSLDLFRKGMMGKTFKPWLGEDATISEVTDAEYIAALYDGEVRHADHYIGRLMAKLEELGLTDDTMVLLTSDHGETLIEPNNIIYGQQCFYGHLNLYDPNIHIPLIVRAPDKITEGIVVEPFAQQIDIVPTVLELLEIEYDGNFDGISLVPALGGAPTYDLVFVLENTYQKRRAVRSKQWKYIQSLENLRGVPRAELYNLDLDPEELMNVVDLEPEVADQMQLELDRWVQEMMAKWGKALDRQLEHGLPLLPGPLKNYEKQGE